MTILCMECGYFGLEENHPEHHGYRVTVSQGRMQLVAGCGTLREASEHAIARAADEGVEAVAVSVDTTNSSRTFLFHRVGEDAPGEFRWLSPSMDDRSYPATWDGEHWDYDTCTLAHGRERGWVK